MNSIQNRGEYLLLSPHCYFSGSDRNTVSAYSNTENMLIIVTTNYGTAQWVTYDLSAFQTVPQVSKFKEYLVKMLCM
jgi:hypothetical protein